VYAHQYGELLGPCFTWYTEVSPPVPPTLVGKGFSLLSPFLQGGGTLTLGERVPDSDEHLSGTERELVLLRTKVEKRSWFLRAALAYSISVTSGLIVHFLANCS
jgi:hypothetical protein